MTSFLAVLLFCFYGFWIGGVGWGDGIVDFVKFKRSMQTERGNPTLCVIPAAKAISAPLVSVVNCRCSHAVQACDFMHRFEKGK